MLYAELQLIIVKRNRVIIKYIRGIGNPNTVNSQSNQPLRAGFKITIGHRTMSDPF